MHRETCKIDFWVRFLSINNLSGFPRFTCRFMICFKSLQARYHLCFIILQVYHLPKCFTAVGWHSSQLLTSLSCPTNLSLHVWYQLVLHYFMSISQSDVFHWLMLLVVESLYPWVVTVLVQYISTNLIHQWLVFLADCVCISLQMLPFFLANVEVA